MASACKEEYVVGTIWEGQGIEILGGREEKGKGESTFVKYEKDVEYSSPDIFETPSKGLK